MRIPFEFEYKRALSANQFLHTDDIFFIRTDKLKMTNYMGNWPKYKFIMDIVKYFKTGNPEINYFSMLYI